jgi:hypothetical protein
MPTRTRAACSTASAPSARPCRYDQLLLARAHRRCHALVRAVRPVVLQLAAWILLRMLFKTAGATRRLAYDRMDNLAKAARIEGDVFAIYAAHDEMMDTSIARRCTPRPCAAALLRREASAPPRRSHASVPPPTPAPARAPLRPRLLLARYGHAAPSDLIERRLLAVPGGHCCFFGDVPELAHKYTQYLHSCGFLPR